MKPFSVMRGVVVLGSGPGEFIRPSAAIRSVQVVKLDVAADRRSVRTARKVMYWP